MQDVLVQQRENDFDPKKIPQNEGKAIVFKVYDGGKKENKTY